MTNTWALSALWVGLALAATLLAIWFKISTALSEIVVGTVAQLVIGLFLAQGGLLGNTQWISFLAGTGAIVLTFLAGAELDPAIFRTKWREALVIGLAGFFGPFLGCTAIAHYLLHWSIMSSWLCPRLQWPSCMRSCSNWDSMLPSTASRSLPRASSTTSEL
jgi:Kef-type K+ transport system membrane component KefB